MVTISELILYVFSAFIILYVANRYFSGGRYRGTKPNLWGQVAVVTGGNTGIGKQTVLSLAQQGCRVIFGSRDTKKNESVVREINEKIGKNLVEGYALDLSDIESIKNFVGLIKQQKIDYLVNNAGMMALPNRTLTKQGFEMQFGVNHLGHFYLTYLLYPKLKNTDFFRIINVSSLAHRKLGGFLGTVKPDWEDPNFEKTKYDGSISYSRSKLCNNLFTHALAQKIPQNKGIVLSLHPGVVRTELTRYLLDASWKQLIYRMFNPIMFIFTKSPYEGVQTTLKCLYQEVGKLVNGGFYADCSLSVENVNVTQENWKRLWELSERELKIKFEI